MLTSRCITAAFACALVALGGCKRSSPEPSAAPAASASTSVASAPLPERCKAAAPGARFAIGEPVRTPPAGEDGEEAEALQPFAAEVGGALGIADGFAVPALKRAKDGTVALVALVDAHAGGGKLVELGRVHGDNDPPALARSGDDLFVAVPDHDPSHAKLRLAQIRNVASAPELVWGGEVAQGRGESLAFDLAVAGEHGVLVWDEDEKRGGRSLVRLATFNAKNPGTLSVPRSIAAEGFNRELPELVTRGKGYWLAWVASVFVEQKSAGPRPAAKPTQNDADAAVDPEQSSVLELGNRFIELVALDENGSPAGQPIAVSPKDRHVLVFDLAPAPDGAALIAWRDDDSAPGNESRIVQLAHVSKDGKVAQRVLDDEHVGAGAPSLIADPRDPSAPVWLALESVDDETQVAALRGTGEQLDGLAAEPLLGGGELLAASQGRLLVARPHSLAIELSAVTCKPGAPPAR